MADPTDPVAGQYPQFVPLCALLGREPGCTLDLPRNYTRDDLNRFKFASYKIGPSSSAASVKISTACVLAAWGIALLWILFIVTVCVRAVLKDQPEREKTAKLATRLRRSIRDSAGSDVTLIGSSRSRASDITLLGSTTHSGFLPTPPLPATWRGREGHEDLSPRVSRFVYTPVAGTTDWIDDLELMEPRHVSYGY